MESFDLSDQSSDRDVENVETIDNEMDMTARISKNSNNPCVCACHNNDKRNGRLFAL